MPKPKILITTGSQGHKSISSNIEDILKCKYQTSQFKSKYLDKLDTPYNFVYKTIPQLATIPWYLSNAKSIEKIYQKEIDKKISPLLEKEIKKNKPNIIINCHWSYSYSLNKLQAKYSYQNLNVLGDPRSPHKTTFNPACKNLVFDKKIKSPISQDKLISSGWFTQKKFYQPLLESEKNKIYNRLGFSKNIPTFLICGGSEGMSSIVKILPAFINSPKKIQLIIICGANKTLKKTLDLFSSNLPILTTKKPSNLNLKILGFTKNIDQYIKISDLVIGKAGPNLLFETVAAQKPFFAISNMPGQEVGNLDLIKEHNIGIVEKNPIKASKIIKKIICNPSSLDKYQKNIKRLRNYNQGSENVLLNQVKKLLSSQ